MVGAVLPPGQLACAGAAELLVAVPARDDEDLVDGADPGEARPPAGQSPRAAAVPRRLHRGEEPHVAGVAVGDPGQGRQGLELGGGLADGGQREGEDDSSRGADPEHVLHCQEGGHSEAGRLVLPDDLVAAAQHLGHTAGQAQLGQADVVGGVKQPDGGGALLGDADCQAGLHDGQDDLGLVTPHRDHVVDLPGDGVQDLDGVAGAAPDVAGHHHHPAHRVGGAADCDTLEACFIPETAWKQQLLSQLSSVSVLSYWSLGSR